MSEKEDLMTFDGIVQELLPNAMFRVKLDNDHVVLYFGCGAPILSRDRRQL